MKNDDFKLLIILIFVALIIGGVVWFFGWRVERGEIIVNKSINMSK
mgnify:CR=1 FL=1